jgi:hypothetical protein
MTDEHGLVDSRRITSLAGKFHDKQYRDGYVAAHTRGVLARQMRNFRGELSQAEYAAKIDKQKTVVGRLENPAYGGWSVRTMLDIARKENVGVIARFVDFPTFLGFTDDMSDGALCPKAYDGVETDEFAAFVAQTNATQPATISYYDLRYPVDLFLNRGIAMGPPLYGDMFFGQPATSTYTAPSSANTFIFNLPSNALLATAFSPPLQSNTGMRDLIRQRDQQIFALRSEVMRLRTEIAQLYAEPDRSGTEDLLSRRLRQPQSNVVPFPNAA